MMKKLAKVLTTAGAVLSIGLLASPANAWEIWYYYNADGGIVYGEGRCTTDPAVVLFGAPGNAPGPAVGHYVVYMGYGNPYPC